MEKQEGPSLLLTDGKIESGWLRLRFEEPTILRESTPRIVLEAVKVEHIDAIKSLIEPTRRFHGLRIIMKSGVAFEAWAANDKLTQRLVMEVAEYHPFKYIEPELKVDK